VYQRRSWRVILLEKISREEKARIALLMKPKSNWSRTMIFFFKSWLVIPDEQKGAGKVHSRTESNATRLAATLFVLIKCNKLRLHKVKYNRNEMKIGLVRWSYVGGGEHWQKAKCYIKLFFFLSPFGCRQSNSFNSYLFCSKLTYAQRERDRGS